MPKKTTETWLPVVGYEGIYEVSDMGRVRSVDRVITNRKGVVRRLKGIVLSPKTVRFGYQQVNLSNRNKKRMQSVHRLILTAFVGPCPEGKEACHKDGDPANNRLDNLRWGTKSSNQLDRQIHGTHHQRNKTHCPRGHALRSPNLVAYRARQGHRVCLACDRASSYISRRQEYRNHMQEISDQYYSALIEDGKVKS